MKFANFEVSTDEYQGIQVVLIEQFAYNTHDITQIAIYNHQLDSLIQALQSLKLEYK